MDAKKGNGLSLEQLVHRLEVLQRENAQRLETQARRLQMLERENAELRHEVSALRASGTGRNEVAKSTGSEARLDGKLASVLEGRVSRRSLLSKAGAAAVAAMAAGTLLKPQGARAHDLGDTVTANHMYTHTLTADIDADMAADGWAVQGTNPKGTGVWGKSAWTGYGGVYGQHTGSMGYGVIGDGKGANGAGVIGKNSGGVGVEG